LELPKQVKTLVRVLVATGEMTGSARVFNVNAVQQAAAVCGPRADNKIDPVQIRNCKVFGHHC
jgi:hypothetical protein